MKPLCALCAILLLAGCSGQKSSKMAYDAIARLEHASSLSDFEARLRDAETVLDDHNDGIDSKQYGALLDYKFSVTALRRQLDHELYIAEAAKGLPNYATLIDSEAKDTEDFQKSLESCRDDAWRAIYGKEPVLAKTKAGDCRKLEQLRIAQIQQQNTKDVTSKK